MATMPLFKSFTMASQSWLLSPPSLFYTKPKHCPFHSLRHSSRLLRFQVASFNSSSFLSLSRSLCLTNRTIHHSPMLTFVAQASDWAQQQEVDGEEEEATWENEGEPKWVNQDDEIEAVIDGSEGEGEGGFDETSEDAKLFVGNLPFDVDSQRLAMLFEQAGTVEIAEVIYNRATDRSRGFGFVTMSTVEEADRAVEKFSGYELDGRTLTVNKAAPRGSQPERSPRTFDSSLRVYVGNLPWDVDNIRLEQIFSEHGKVEQARIVYDRETGRSRGFGFVTMSSETDMNDAIAALDGQSLDGRSLRVSVAEERPRRSF
ncbi:hypothetical protein HN51_001561 [Arachis hypogaea]|uniref:28 kDa ribonucleoprotein, chloroplastic n=1 Tax=Arachis hypogaea TaxID=3818 RepID=UPI000DED077D|nr:28 kDa ribonucleoprotein, chloroplastic [Arachis hypogaea]QHO49682.1 31 kDa ribonucleoprotein [Arachis hypogaea]